MPPPARVALLTRRLHGRSALHLDNVPLRRGAVAHSVAKASLAALRRAVWRLGVLGPPRQLSWKLVVLALRRGRENLPRAVMFAVVGESLIRYTHEVLLPRIDAALAEIARGAGGRGGGVTAVLMPSQLGAGAEETGVAP